MSYLMGIDIGTTGCKVSIYDKELNLHGTGYRNYKIISKHTGWAEESPNEWWDKTSEAMYESIKMSGIEATQICAIGVSCTNGIVPVDEDGNPLYNVIMQIDGRATKQASELEKIVGIDEIFRITGNRVASGTFSAPAIMWLKENEPIVYSKTYKFLSPTGYIVNKLTGEFSIDHTRASTTLVYDIRKGEWSEKICNLLGIDMDKLPNIFHSEEIVGNIKEEVANRLGLSDKTSVIAGVMDSVAACISLGVTGTRKPALIIGTVARLCLPSKRDYFDNRFLNTFYYKDIPYLTMTPVNGGGLSIRWFTEKFCSDDMKKAEARGIDFYKLLEEKARDIPPGCNSLIYLPYLVGERSPIWNPKARGMFFGISHNHTKYHFYRSVMEGVAFAVRHNLEIYKEMYDTEIEYITISGGGAKSKLWCSIFSDILSAQIVIPKVVETETKGSAVLAGLGVGLFSSLNQILGGEDDLCLITPNPDNKKKYNLLFDVYKNLYKHCINDYNDLYDI